MTWDQTLSPAALATAGRFPSMPMLLLATSDRF